jgi:tmRNA-binding protein
MARTTERRLAMHAAVIDPIRDDNQDVEELRLLLHTSEMRALTAAARPEGLTAAGLALHLIRDYLLWMQSDLGKAFGRNQRGLVSEEER